jgi:hypothetical protein
VEAVEERLFVVVAPSGPKFAGGPNEAAAVSEGVT